MIGGYIYKRPNLEIDNRLRQKLDPSFDRVDVWDHGYLFHDSCFGSDPSPCSISDDLIVLSQDMLVTPNSDGEYEPVDLQTEFPKTFMRNRDQALDAIVSDFRMAVVQKKESDPALFLASHRAGSGRIYYSQVESGVLFASDLRFLLGVVEFNVNPMALYALLKYGAVPDPMTICDHISAVPPAHYLKYELRPNEITTHPYFKFNFAYGDNEISKESPEEILTPVKEAIEKSARYLKKSNPVMLLSGGVDSSLYAAYLNPRNPEELKAFYCAFGENDPEFPYAKSMAERIGIPLEVAKMEKRDALGTLEDVTRLTDHPFSDFSSLPIAFLLKHIRQAVTGPAVVIECNGGDDCFGFVHLAGQRKYLLKHRFPAPLKTGLSSLLKRYPYWKWKSHIGILARISALADVHEMNYLDYFLVQAPVNYLDFQVHREWNQEIETIMESVFSNCANGYEGLSYKARTTIRQLLHINSRQWAAKALSVGESLGLRIIYPFIWRDILHEQGKLPWHLKINNSIVKWPLKKLLQDFMPHDFIYRKKSGFVPPFVTWLTDRDFNQKVRDILFDSNGHVYRIVPSRILDELLSDALKGKDLRSPILNFLWGAIFTEMWIKQYKRTR